MFHHHLGEVLRGVLGAHAGEDHARLASLPVSGSG